MSMIRKIPKKSMGGKTLSIYLDRVLSVMLIVKIIILKLSTNIIITSKVTQLVLKKRVRVFP